MTGCMTLVGEGGGLYDLGLYDLGGFMTLGVYDLGLYGLGGV